MLLYFYHDIIIGDYRALISPLLIYSTIAPPKTVDFYHEKMQYFVLQDPKPGNHNGQTACSDSTNLTIYIEAVRPVKKE